MGARARAAEAIVLHIIALLAMAGTAYAGATNTTTNPLQKAVGIANNVADLLKKLAYAIILIAAFIGVINYAFGRGPEWLGRAVMAAIALSIVLWLIGQFMA